MSTQLTSRSSNLWLIIIQVTVVAMTTRRTVEAVEVVGVVDSTPAPRPVAEVRQRPEARQRYSSLSFMHLISRDVLLIPISTQGRGSNTLRPVTIKQILEATQDLAEAPFKIDGIEISHVCPLPPPILSPPG